MSGTALSFGKRASSSMSETKLHFSLHAGKTLNDTLLPKFCKKRTRKLTGYRLTVETKVAFPVVTLLHRAFFFYS